MPNERMTRAELCKFLPCSLTKLYYLESSGKLDGCYYSIGRRKFYITDRVRQWQESGGEMGNSYGA